MGRVIEHIPKDEQCEFCGRRATLLCDMPKGTYYNTVDFKRRFTTCDKRICEKCTTRVYGFDYCPDCIRLIKSTKKGIDI